MPVCVFHAGAGLPAEECVAPVRVSRLIVNGGYVKIRTRFFKRLERAELFPVIPAEKKKSPGVFKNNALSLFCKIRRQSCAVKRLACDEIKQRRSDKSSHPKPLLQLGCCPSFSKASGIPELVCPSPSPSLQPCLSITRRPTPYTHTHSSVNRSALQ